jgi:serine/threonine protein kinase
MGNIIDSCCKKKDEDDIWDKGINNKQDKLISNIGDKYCQGTVKIEFNDTTTSNDNQDLISSSGIYKNQFFSDPLRTYKIVSELSENLKSVCLIDNSSIIRLMKIIPKKNKTNNKKKIDPFLVEAEKLQLLEHPNILKIFEIYIFKDNYYIIFDNFEENNLVEKVKTGEWAPNEVEIKTIMNYIFNSIVYLHEKNVFNIELKLKVLSINPIVLKSTKKVLKKRKQSQEENNKKNGNTVNYELKLSVVDYLKENYELTEVDKLLFYSPEIYEQIEQNNIIKNTYNESNYINNTYDEWACGVLMYYLISGEFPFKGETKEEIYSNIKNTNLDFSSTKFNSISQECKDLISKLLEKDKNKRIKCNECFNHPFMKEEKFKRQDSEISIELDSIDLLKNLLNIKKPKSKFHELIIAYLSFNFINKDEEKKLKFLFNYIDKDHNNIISEEDIKESFTKNNIEFTEEQIKNILYVFDYDKNNLIQYQEFLRVLCDKEDLYKEENMKSVFNVIDDDKDEYINADDLKKFVPNNEGIKNKIEEEFMAPFGMNPNDKMIFNQFYEIITKDKTYPEVNKIRSRIEKAKQLKKLFQMEKDKEGEVKGEGEREEGMEEGAEKEHN